jgi:hypothetical protein
MGQRKGFYYLFGGSAVNSYLNEGLDGVKKGFKNGAMFEIYHYDEGQKDPNDLLKAFIGWSDWYEIQEDEYDNLLEFINSNKNKIQ